MLLSVVVVVHAHRHDHYPRGVGYVKWDIRIIGGHVAASDERRSCKPEVRISSVTAIHVGWQLELERGVL